LEEILKEVPGERSNTTTRRKIARKASRISSKEGGRASSSAKREKGVTVKKKSATASPTGVPTWQEDLSQISDRLIIQGRTIHAWEKKKKREVRKKGDIKEWASLHKIGRVNSYG